MLEEDGLAVEDGFGLMDTLIVAVESFWLVEVPGGGKVEDRDGL